MSPRRAHSRTHSADTFKISATCSGVRRVMTARSSRRLPHASREYMPEDCVTGHRYLTHSRSVGTHICGYLWVVVQRTHPPTDRVYVHPSVGRWFARSTTRV